MIWVALSFLIGVMSGMAISFIILQESAEREQ